MKTATALTRYVGTANHKDQHSKEHHEGLKIFGANSDLSSEDMSGRFKIWAKQNHPDVGGDHDRFARAARAFHDAKDGAVSNPEYIDRVKEKANNALSELRKHNDPNRQEVIQKLVAMPVLTSFGIHNHLKGKERQLRSAGHHDIADEYKKYRRKHLAGGLIGSAVGAAAGHKAYQKMPSKKWGYEDQMHLLNVHGHDTENGEKIRKAYRKYQSNRHGDFLAGGIGVGNALGLAGSSILSRKNKDNISKMEKERGLQWKTASQIKDKEEARHHVQHAILLDETMPNIFNGKFKHMPEKKRINKLRKNFDVLDKIEEAGKK